MIASPEASANDSGKLRVRRVRITGRGGLARELARWGAAAGSGNSCKLVVFADWDGTLSNGFAPPGMRELERRVRGGQATLDALLGIQRLSASVVIVTARPPRRAVLEQLAASLRGAQRELGAVLGVDQSSGEGSSRGDGGSHGSPRLVASQEVLFCGVPLALWAGSGALALYAAAYEKPAAVAHYLCQCIAPGERTEVLFVDDAVVNAHDVAERLARLLLEAGRADLLQSASVTSLWWDTFDEVMTGEMVSVGPDSPDYPHTAHLDGALAAFGLVDAAERRRRDAALRALESRQPSPGSLKPDPPRAPGRLKVDAALETLLSRDRPAQKR